MSFKIVRVHFFILYLTMGVKMSLLLLQNLSNLLVSSYVVTIYTVTLNFDSETKTGHYVD